MIRVSNLNKKFKNEKGIFNLNFKVEKGEVFGFIGPNGAGKSTTIRHLMGFLHGNSGSAQIAGYDCWKESEKVKSITGYLPGEIVFPEGMSAKDFIKLQEEMKNVENTSSTKQLIEMFNLNINIPIKKMSKGMKQKLAIVVTFMSNPDVIILDEPSTGLDPLMQKKLIDLIKEEKQKGKTIFLSSHIFEEIEDVADRICFIKNGMIVENKDIDTIYRENRQTMIATFNSNVSDKLKIPFNLIDKNKVAITIDNNINNVIRELASYDVKTISMKNVSLRKIFERYYIDEVN